MGGSGELYHICVLESSSHFFADRPKQGFTPLNKPSSRLFHPNIVP